MMLPTKPNKKDSFEGLDDKGTNCKVSAAVCLGEKIKPDVFINKNKLRTSQ